MKPRVLFVGRTRYALRSALTHAAQVRRARPRARSARRSRSARASAAPASSCCARRAALDGPLLLLHAPFASRASCARFGPDAMIAQSPYEGLVALAARRLARSRAAGRRRDPRRLAHRSRASTAPRARRSLAPLGGPAGGAGRSGTRCGADASPTSRPLVRDARRRAGRGVPHVHRARRVRRRASPRRCPTQPRALFVGVLERVQERRRAGRGLACSPRLGCPDAALELVGDGRQRGRRRGARPRPPGQTSWHRRLEPAQVAARSTASWCLVLPSRSRGSAARRDRIARPRPAGRRLSRAAASRTLVRDGENGAARPSRRRTALADGARRGFLRRHSSPRGSRRRRGRRRVVARRRRRSTRAASSARRRQRRRVTGARLVFVTQQVDPETSEPRCRDRRWCVRSRSGSTSSSCSRSRACPACCPTTARAT